MCPIYTKIVYNQHNCNLLLQVLIQEMLYLVENPVLTYTLINFYEIYKYTTLYMTQQSYTLAYSTNMSICWNNQHKHNKRYNTTAFVAGSADFVLAFSGSFAIH